MAEEGAKSGNDAASDRIRETAKWFAVSLAAVGVVLAAGTQLTQLGSLETSSPRFDTAILGGSLFALGAIFILGATGWTLVSPSLDLDSLASRPPSGVSAHTKSAYLAGCESVGALQTSYDEAVRARRDNYDAHLKNPVDQDLRLLAEASHRRAVELTASVRTLTGAASYELLSHRWFWGKWIVLVGSVLAGTGIALFAWAANPPEDAAASAARPNVLTAPSVKALTLTPLGQRVLASQLGPSCPVAKTIKVELLAATDAGSDVLIAQDGCTRLRILVGPTWGILR